MERSERDSAWCSSMHYLRNHVEGTSKTKKALKISSPVPTPILSRCIPDTNHALTLSCTCFGIALRRTAHYVTFSRETSH
jgi:hypothetical protein